MKRHAHRIRVPGIGMLQTEYDAIMANPNPLQYDGDFGDELGAGIGSLIGTVAGGALGSIIGSPTVGAALGGAVGGGIESAVDSGGKKKPAAGAGAGAAATGGAAGGDLSSLLGFAGIRDVVAELLATVPPPVRDQVRSVIAEVQAQGGSMKNAEAELVKNIEKQFLPTVQKAVDALKLAQTQRLATSEHNSITQDAKRWDNLNASQKRIQASIAAQSGELAALRANVDRLMTGAKIIPKRAVPYAGGNAHLDILSGKTEYVP